MNKWYFAISHGVPSFLGVLRLFFSDPLFCSKLVTKRIQYFLFRKFEGAFLTPDGFKVETANELISYWSFFLERECWSDRWIRELLDAKNPTVLDVGANAGLFSHLVWTLNKNTNLMVFDPLPKMAEKVRKWGSANKVCLEVFNLAVSDRIGTANFFTAAENDTTASLSSPGSGKEVVTVSTSTLDEIVGSKAILLMKIDVEGHEPQVLKGAEKVLQNTRFLIVEAHTSEALRKITEVLPKLWHYEKIGASDYLFYK
jgi:FkbM family methyltransferase